MTEMAYVTGNRQGLLSYMGLPASMATALAGQWISIPPTDRGFTSVISGLTLSSALHRVTPAGSISQGKQKTVNGQSTISVSGTGSTGQARTSLFIATKGNRLPVEAVAATGNGKAVSGEIVTFSRLGRECPHAETSDVGPDLQPQGWVGLIGLTFGNSNEGPDSRRLRSSLEIVATVVAEVVAETGANVAVGSPRRSPGRRPRWPCGTADRSAPDLTRSATKASATHVIVGRYGTFREEFIST